MASSPQPSNVHEGAESAEADENPTVQPASAEDRKAAAALSALEARGGEEDDDKKSKDVDTEALGKAMKDLDVKDEGKKEVKKEERKVKVDAADVGLLVEQLELSKAKATELLKAHDGDAVKAMIAFVKAEA